MSNPVSSSFRQYAFLSVQVDQYLNATSIFAQHYGRLKFTYDLLPVGKDWPTNFESFSEKARGFFIAASSMLNYMGTTNIFADAPYLELRNLPDDMLRFGFYTCFCFQWSLFETFVRESVLDIAEHGFLQPTIASGLNARKFRTREFLKYIDDGNVFGHTPFKTVLLVPGWIQQTEICGFADLDVIRKRRNELIHAASNPSILLSGETDGERMYMRSTTILRNFAGNLDQDVQATRCP